MNYTVCVLAFRPYKYTALSRRIVTYYYLIPADVFYLSPFATTYYHPSDKLPRSVQFKTSKREYNVFTRMFSFVFKLLEFYTVFYHLFRNSPTIVHLIATQFSKPALFAIELYSFYKKCKLVIHLDKMVDDEEVEVFSSFVKEADAANTVFLTSDSNFLVKTSSLQYYFTQVNGFLHFDYPMINRVNLLTTALFAQPERTASGVRTLFEYFEFRGNGMVYGHINAGKPALIGIPCTKSTDFDAVWQTLEDLEANANGKQYVVVLTQEPSRKAEQFKRIDYIVKNSRNYYAPTNSSANKFLNEKKPFENVFVSRMMFTDMDFDLFLQLCSVVTVFDQRALNDMLCLKQQLVAYNCKSDKENVILIEDAKKIAECITEVAYVDLKPNTNYLVFEDIMKESVGFEVYKDLAFYQPYKEESCGCGGCGGCDKQGGCDGCDNYGQCGGCDKYGKCGDCGDCDDCDDCHEHAKKED